MSASRRIAAAVLIAGTQAHAQAPAATTRIATGVQAPNCVFLSQPPGEVSRLYLLNQRGIINVLKDGVASTFLDIRSLVYSGGESGLLGLAFHPHFQKNGYLYLFYTRGPASGASLVVRYSTDPASPDQASPESAFPVLSIPRQIVGNHNAGWIGFGPDGYLYIAVGDGAGPGGIESVTLTSMLGKMVRIDVDHDDFPADTNRNYAIPPTNPLVGSTAGLPEIWARGLRNPWRNSFDRQTGELWIGDVGDGHSGEINIQPAAWASLRHYGYPCFEGTHCRVGLPGCSCTDPAYTAPIHEVDTPGAIIGGYAYRGSAIPSLQGTYFFADYIGKIWSFRYGSAVTEFTDRTAELRVHSGTIHSFGEDSAGELYICTANDGIYKIVPPCHANCDATNIEPRLTANDFQCFLNKFAAGDPYANCDGSTTPPILDGSDFYCFLLSFRAGCP